MFGKLREAHAPPQAQSTQLFRDRIGPDRFFDYGDVGGFSSRFPFLQRIGLLFAHSTSHCSLVALLLTIKPFCIVVKYSPMK
jgi:hypothetical protein